MEMEALEVSKTMFRPPYLHLSWFLRLSLRLACGKPQVVSVRNVLSVCVCMGEPLCNMEELHGDYWLGVCHGGYRVPWT